MLPLTRRLEGGGYEKDSQKETYAWTKETGTKAQLQERVLETLVRLAMCERGGRLFIRVMACWILRVIMWVKLDRERL
jgi:hypothetical protein